jgi:hypothetical protein
MFQVLPGRTSIGVGPDRIIAVIESINAPNIAIPDVGTERTKAWLIGCITPSGGACVFCYLLLTESNRPILYISNPAEVALDSYAVLEHQSIQFVESMGFLLDNLNFRARPPQEMAMLVATLPFFHEPSSHVVVGAVVDDVRPQQVPTAPALPSTASAAGRQALLRLLALY